MTGIIAWNSPKEAATRKIRLYDPATAVIPPLSATAKQSTESPMAMSRIETKLPAGTIRV